MTATTEPKRRQAILEAAFQDIAARGLEGLRLRQVAAAAGIDHSTLHHYFTTKQDLIEGVVQMTIAPLRHTIPSTGTPAERIRAHLSMLSGMIEARPEVFVVLAEVDLRARRDHAIRGIIETIESGWRDGLMSLFEQIATGQGGTPSPHPRTQTELVIATVKGIRLNPAHATAVLDALAWALEDVLPPKTLGSSP